MIQTTGERASRRRNARASEGGRLDNRRSPDVCARRATHSRGSPIVLPCRPTAVAAGDRDCGLGDRSTRAVPGTDAVRALQPPTHHRVVAACPVLHGVAEGEVLPLGVNSVGTWATGVVQVVPGVPFPTIPAQLYQPRPDLIWRGVDRDGDRPGPSPSGTRSAPGYGPLSLGYDTPVRFEFGPYTIFMDATRKRL